MKEICCCEKCPTCDPVAAELAALRAEVAAYVELSGYSPALSCCKSAVEHMRHTLTRLTASRDALAAALVKAREVMAVLDDQGDRLPMGWRKPHDGAIAAALAEHGSGLPAGN